MAESVRSFSRATTSQLVFGSGDSSINVTGAITVAVLARPELPATNEEFFVSGLKSSNSSSGCWALGISSGTEHKLVYYVGGGSAGNNLTSWQNKWGLFVASKEAGETKPTLYSYLFETSTWTKTTGSTARPNSAEVAKWQIANWGATINGEAENFSGRMAAVGLWNKALSESEVHSLVEVTALSKWSEKSPVGLWFLNQESVEEEVKDQTAHGSNQTERTATTVVAEAPPIKYGLANVVEGKATLTGTGTLSPKGTVTRSGKATISGSGTLSGKGTVTRLGKATLSGEGTLSPVGRSFGSYAREILGTAGLQSYWRFEEPEGQHFLDSKGSVTSVTESSVTHGAKDLISTEPGSAAEFTASSSGVSFGNVYGFTAKSAMSFEFYISVGAVGTNVGIISKMSSNELNYYYYVRKFENNKIGFFRGNGTTSTSITSDTALEANKRYHVVATYDGTTMKLYINGKIQSETAASSIEIPTSTSPFKLGRNVAANDNSFTGIVDDVAVYNVALSEATVKTHYNASIWTTGGSIAGSGTLAASGGIVRVGKATLTGTGTLAPKGLREASGKATISGNGTLAPKGTSWRVGKATIQGSGTLAPKGTRSTLGKATISGTGTLKAGSATIIVGKATLTGIGTLSPKGVRYVFGNAKLEGLGSLAPKGTRIVFTGGSLAGTSELLAAGRNLVVRAVATIEGTGAFTAKGMLIVIGQASILGQGILVAEGTGRSYLTNPPTQLIIAPNITMLSLAPMSTTLPLDPNKTDLDLDPNITTLVLDD